MERAIGNKNFNPRLDEMGRVKIGDMSFSTDIMAVGDLVYPRYYLPPYRWTKEHAIIRFGEVGCRLDISPRYPFVINCNSHRYRIMIGPYSYWMMAQKMISPYILVHAICVNIFTEELEKKLADRLEKIIAENNGKSYWENLAVVLKEFKKLKKKTCYEEY